MSSTLTQSPSRNGRKIMSNTPAAKLESAKKKAAAIIEDQDLGSMSKSKMIQKLYKKAAKKEENARAQVEKEKKALAAKEAKAKAAKEAEDKAAEKAQKAAFAGAEFVDLSLPSYGDSTTAKERKVKIERYLDEIGESRLDFCHVTQVRSPPYSRGDGTDPNFFLHFFETTRSMHPIARSEVWT